MSLRQTKGMGRAIGGEKGYEMVVKGGLRKDYLNAS